MSQNLKKGLLKLEGSDPMTFTESDDAGPLAPWTEEQKAL